MLHATITPLGSEVVACYRYQLKHGTRLHWRKLHRWQSRKRDREHFLALEQAAKAARAAT